MKTTAVRQREVWMDFARGLGVILVVFGHVLGGVVRANIFPDGPLAAWMDYTVYTFHMPLFFFLAGLNVPYSLRHGPATFLTGKLWTIAYPYVLWSLIQGAIIMMFARDSNIPIYPADLAAIWYSPIGQFWFLYALMICHVIVALMPNRSTIIAVAAIGLVAYYIMPVRPTLALTLHHFPFYVFGLCAARAAVVWRPSLQSLAAVAAAFAIAVYLGGRWTAMDANGLGSLPACILGIIGVMMVSKLLHGSHPWLAAIGLMSMTIYILHILAASGLRIVMVKMHIPPSPWFYLLAGTVAGVVLPMIVHTVLRRMRLLSALGLAPINDHQPARESTVDQTPVRG